MSVASYCIAVLAVAAGTPYVAAADGSDQEWRAVFQTATLLSAEGDFQAAERALTDAIPLARGVGPQSRAMALTLNSLGSVHQHLDSSGSAERCYRRALAIWDQLPDGEPLGLVTILNNLSRLYIDNGRVAEAERLLRRARLLYPEPTDDSDRQFARTQEQMFLAALQRQNYREAEALVRKLIEFCGRGFGPAHPDTALAWNDLGQLESATGRHAEAIAHLSRSLGMLEGSIGRDHPSTIKVLVNLALAHAGAGRPGQGEPFLKRALRISETRHGPESPRTARVLAQYAGLLGKLKRKAEARRLQQRSRDILAKSSIDSRGRVVDVSQLQE